MKTPTPFYRLLIAVIVIFAVTSCDQPKSSNSSAQTNDTESVKKMSADSNSAMPIHTPKDSTEKIPNAYDTTKK